jgi:hypothetical protein
MWDLMSFFGFVMRQFDSSIFVGIELSVGYYEHIAGNVASA